MRYGRRTKITLIERFAVFDRVSWQTDGYGINFVKVTFDGNTLIERVRGLEGVQTTTWAIDKNNQRLIVNQYSYGRLSNTCSFTRDL